MSIENENGLQWEFLYQAYWRYPNNTDENLMKDINMV